MVTSRWKKTKGSMWLHLLVVALGLGVGLWMMGTEDKLDSLRGKRVIVTGASGGIGESLAYEYAKRGANVVVTARRQKELEKVSGECRRLGLSNSSHKAVAADMKDVESIRNLVKQAVDHLGGLDIVVLNHITKTPIMPFTGDQDSLDIVYSTMDINFRSYVQMAAMTMPHLTKSEGGFVVINSVMGSIVNPKLAPYVASKFALNGFFDSLRSQFILENRNVAVTSCILGLIGTPNAVEGLKMSGSAVLDFTTPASVDATAQAIVAGGANRVNIVYYPPISTRFYIQILNKFFPSLVDWLQRWLFTN